MSEKKKLEEIFKKDLQKLRDNCPHTETKPYNCQIYTADYCLKCGTSINIILKKIAREKFE